jgi:hypothetical protein
VSSGFKQLFEIEEAALVKIQKRWRMRVWRRSYFGQSRYQA